MAIKVQISQDRTGSVILQPVSARVCRTIEKHLAQFGEKDCSVFFQEHRGDEFMAEYLKPAERRHVEQGYSITVMMSDYNYGMLRGWDLSEVELSPKRSNADTSKLKNRLMR